MRSKEERLKRRRRMIKQRLMGVGIVLLCIVMVKFAMTGMTPEDRDVSFVVLLLPLGVYMTFTRHCLVL